MSELEVGTEQVDFTSVPTTDIPMTERNQRLGHMVAILLATIFLIFWVLFARSANVYEPFSTTAFNEIGFNIYLFGPAIAELALPLFLLFLVSRTQFFGRIVGRLGSRTDQIRLTAILIAIQLLFLFYQHSLEPVTENIVTYGYFVVIVAGLLGGWQAGLLVGLVTTIGVGTFDYSTWEWVESFELASYLNDAILTNIPAMAAIWLGFVTGHTVEILPPDRRFQPALISTLSALALCVIAIGVFFSVEDASYYFEQLVPRVLLVALALILFSSMARDLLNEASLREAETTALALAQTQLDLTQTQLALAEAELRALHAQINPHFFFNALNTIRYFIRTDPASARDLLTKLSEIFQRVLNAGEFVPLQEEIRHVEAYLALEKARMDERLQIIWTNLAKEMLDQQVPTLILQPLVENSVIHGINPKPDGGTVHIVINRIGDELLLQVDDDGVGFDGEVDDLLRDGDMAEAEADPTDETGNGQPVRPSLGIKNVDGRLRWLYGEEYGLVFESEPGKGTRALVRIPLKDNIH